MPFEFGEITTPAGRTCLLIESSGHVGLADGHAMDAQLMPGMPHHGGLVFSRAAKGTEFSAELRRFFPNMVGRYRAMAAVTGSPLVRAAINLMVRFTPDSAQTFRMFGSEAEALAWLDARAEE